MLVFKICHFFIILHRINKKNDSDKWTMGGSLSFKVVSKPHIITLKNYQKGKKYIDKSGAFFFLIIVPNITILL